MAHEMVVPGTRRNTTIGTISWQFTTGSPPTKVDQAPLRDCDWAAYLESNSVERLTNRLRPWRRVTIWSE